MALRQIGRALVGVTPRVTGRSLRYASDGYAAHNDSDPPMPEEWEILGGQNDQQMVADTDPYVSPTQAFFGVLGFFGFCGSVYGLISVVGVPEKPTVGRVMPPEGEE
eukprot:TRINITY_DN15338_c0_g1_i1.p1 TRINITY_DN15338_c0_g1~~TRINITY_DN15338_c0_g1_i1.p1  ORF type:complete len:107 (+),score=5.54 TRINITY_DN15338_c0_g1_i1:48-368(+)